jgi:hypothetical protein
MWCGRRLSAALVCETNESLQNHSPFHLFILLNSPRFRDVQNDVKRTETLLNSH